MKPAMRRLSTRVVSIVVSIGLVLSASRAQEVLAAVNPPRAATLAVMAVKARREDARGVVAGIEHAVPVGLVEPAPWAMQPMETTTPTASPEATGTVTSTVTPSVDVVPTDNTSATPAPSETLSPTETATATSTPEATATGTATATPTPTPSETAFPTASTTITATEPALQPIGPDDLVLLPVKPDAGGTQGDSQVALVDLIPTGVPLVESAPAQSLRGSPVGVPETVTLPGGKAAAIVLSGRMLVLVEDKAFEAGSTLTVNPVSMRALPAGQLLELDVSQVEATTDESAPAAAPITATDAVSATEKVAEATWASGGEVIRFEITATGPDGKTPLTQFDQAVTIYFDLRGSGLLYPIDSYRFFFHDPAKPDEPVAIPAIVVDQAGLVGFTTRHFSQYSLSSANGPWRMSWNPPAVSEFSGAATYNFPIEVPPGVNGLQPHLSINYSSRSVDGNDYADMDQGILGLGWSMSNIAIIRDGVRPGWQWNNLRAKYWDAYSLVLNGSGHEMIRTNNNVLRLTGNGSAWTQILRQQGVSRETEIQSASVRFKPAGAIVGPGYVVGLTTADGRRFALYGRNDVFVAQYRTTGSGAYSETCDLGTSFANTWYVATFTVNPGGVLTVEVYSEPNPHLRKTCSLNMGGAANDEWLFSAWAYGTNLYLDDYTDTRLAREGVEDARTEEFHDQPSTTYWGWSGAVAVVDDPTSRRYQVMNDPSVFAIQVYQPGSTSGVMNGDHIYWVVKTGDGTTHVLGYEENAEDAQSIGDTQIDNYDGMFTGDLAYRTGVRWNVSWSADVHGNRVTYAYSAHSRSAGFAPPPYPECQGASCYIQNLTTEMNRLEGVYYNFISGSNTAHTSITFTPYTEPDGSGARRVSEIVMTHGGQVMRRVAFTLDKRNFNHPNPCIPTWTYTLNTITVKDWLGNALPTTTFTYADKNTGGCSTWSYLEQVTNGYGASVKFLYTDLGRKSLVVNERQVIASPGGPMARTTYTYLNGCWDQWDNNNLPAGGVGCPASFPYGGYTDRRGGLVGFDQTTAINYAYDGVTVLNRTVSKFWRRADWAPAGFSAIPISNDSWKHLVIGFPAQVIQQDAAGNEIARQDTYYGVITAVWAYFLPVIDQYSRTTIGASFISHSNVAHYDTAWQGGDQYGNATRTWDYNESNASVYRSTLSGFPCVAMMVWTPPAYNLV
jgi:hypothetical protein